MYKHIGSLMVLFVMIVVSASGGAAAGPVTPPTPVATAVRPADGAVMVYVPAGEFLMGSVEGGDSDEQPQHSVYLDAYWIDQTEVTNRQFEAFVAATGYRTDAEKEGTGTVVTSISQWTTAEGADWRHPNGPASSIADRMDVPVVQVSWNDARVYCEWAGVRLPTEAEWEKAARGVDGRKYPWGDEDISCDYAVMWEPGVGKACGQGDGAWPVGGKPAGASPYGALDMTGNVWEWTHDWYDPDYYAESPAINPQGPEKGVEITSRGGSWVNTPAYSRCAKRGSDLPTGSSNVDGFRCAVSESAFKAAVAASKPVHSVLFVGDCQSFSLDRFLPALAASGDPPIEFEGRDLTKGGSSLGWALTISKGKKLQEIREGKWDVVVLQQGVDEDTPEERAKFVEYVRQLDEAIKQGGATTVLYMTIAPDGAEPSVIDDIIAAYTQVGAEIGAKVAPAALAFRRALEARPDLKLYFDDEGHANAYGYYLILCVLYATIFDRGPVGLSYRMEDATRSYGKADYVRMPEGWQLSDEDAAFLQQVAWETVQEYRAQ